MSEKSASLALQAAIEAVRKAQALYNEFLTQVDKIHALSALEEKAPRVRELQKNVNDLYNLKLETPPAEEPDKPSKRKWGGKTEKEVPAKIVWNQQREFNAVTVHLLNELIDYLAPATLQLRDLLEFQIRFFQQITPWIDVKIEALRQEQNRAVAEELDKLAAILASLDPQNKNLNLLVSQFRALQEQLDEKKSEIERHLQEMWFAIRKSQPSFPSIHPDHYELTRIRVELEELRLKLEQSPAQESLQQREAAPTGSPVASMSEDFRYSLFEKIFRGTPEWLTERMKSYVPYFVTAPEPVIDIGCGHGEFLQVMKEINKEAIGIELNTYSSAKAREAGLRVETQDAISFLNLQEKESIGSVFCAQVVEHLHPDHVQELLARLFVVMKPRSTIVIETINPISVFSYHHLYFKDPTHIFPVHPQTLLFLLRAAGFQDVKFEPLTPLPDSDKLEPPPPELAGPLTAYLNGVIARLNEFIYDDLEYFVVGHRP